jgi:hypothetical protein
MALITFLINKFANLCGACSGSITNDSTRQNHLPFHVIHADVDDHDTFGNYAICCSPAINHTGTDDDDAHDTSGRVHGKTTEEKEESIIQPKIIQPMAGSTTVQLPSNCKRDKQYSWNQGKSCWVSPSPSSSPSSTTTTPPLAATATATTSTIPPLEETSTSTSTATATATATSSLPLQIRSSTYRKDKRKQPSSQSLYELIEVDVIYSDKVLLDIGQKYNLEEINRMSNQNTNTNTYHNTEQQQQQQQQQQKRARKVNFLFNKGSSSDTTTTPATPATTTIWHAPNVLIISFLLPTSKPSFGLKQQQKNDHKGYIVTGYFRLRPETIDILKLITSPSSLSCQQQLQDLSIEQKERINAVKLWEKWCITAPTDPNMQKRLKFIPRGDNLVEVGVPSWICKYNGKPMLIKRPGTTNFVFLHHNKSSSSSSKTFSGSSSSSSSAIMEIDVNMHPLPFVFKQGMHHLQQNYFKDLCMTFGFLIEGREEDELPEVLLGDPIRLVYTKHENVVSAKEAFGRY